MNFLDFKKPGPLVLEGNLKENYAKFKQLYTVYATATKTDKEDEVIQVARFLSCAGDSAIELYETFNLTPEEKKKIVKVMQKFEDYCNPRTNEVYERYLFYTRCQREGEPFDHFMADITKLAESCNFGDQKESMLRDRIVIGIADSNVQGKLLKLDGLTLDKAKEYCRIAEITSSQAKEMQEKGFKKSLDEVGTAKFGSIKKHFKNFDVNSRNKEHKFCNYRSVERGKSHCRNSSSTFGETSRGTIQCKYCNKEHRYGNCPAYGKRCKLCMKKNHFASVCKNRRKVSDIQCSDNFEDDNENYYIDSVSSAEKFTKSWYETLVINNTRMEFKLDSGAEVNIIPFNHFEKLQSRPKLNTTLIRLEAYGGHSLKSVGSVVLTVTHKKITIKACFIVVDIIAKPILGVHTCSQLGLIKRIYAINEKTKEKFVSENKDVFTGIGKYPETCSLELNANVKAVHNAPRRVPICLREPLKATLLEMESRGIITKKLGPSEWAHNLVIVEKPNGSLRLCLDPKELNMNIKHEHFLIPKIEDFRFIMRDKKFFSVLDLKDGFWQLSLDEESRNLTVFCTPFGTYQFNVLPFGVSIAPEKFQKLNQKYFGNLPGCFVYIDDIIVGGKTAEEHDTNLQRVLNRAREINVKFNPKKFQYRVSQVKYLGHIFSMEGMSPDPERVRAIQHIKDPENKKDLEKVMGTLNYLRAFIPNFSEINAPLRALLKKSVTFQWTPTHSKTLGTIKDILGRTTILHSFSPDKQIIIQTDASSRGLGCCLIQESKPITFASKSLTSTEVNYAQIEKEFLAIVYACEKFHEYIYGHHIIVHTDHKPLISIMNKQVSQIPSNRLQRMRIKLLKYDIEMKYIPGKNLHVPDLLSRNAHIDREVNTDGILRDVVHSINMSESKRKLFEVKTKDDETLQHLIRVYKDGWPKSRDKLPEQLKFFWNVKDKIYSEGNLVFFEDRIFVPKGLVKNTLELLHEAHLGIIKTIARAKTLFYWPFMNRDVENMIRKCPICEKFQPKNEKHALLPHEIPKLPFEKVGADIFELGSKYYLVVVDYYSKWLEIQPLKGKKSEDVILALKKIFCMHGIPKIMIADNQPFNSFALKEFAEDWNFKFNYSSPRYPKSNGLAEKGVHMAKMLLRKTQEQGKDFYAALLEQRCTVIPRLGYSPSEILLSRKLRTKLPILDSQLTPKIPINLHEKHRLSQETQKKYHDKSRNRKDIELTPGDNVCYQWGKIWKPAKVVDKYNAPRSYIVRNEDQEILRRNTHHLRKSLNEPQFKDPSDYDGDLNLSVLQGGEEIGHQEHTTYLTDLSNRNCALTNLNPNLNLENQAVSAEPSSGYRTRYGREIKKPLRYQAGLDK